MNKNLTVQSRIVVVFVGLCVTANPQLLLSGDAIQRAKKAATLTDIQLAESGVLVGYVLDGQGHPVDKAHVRVFHHDRRIATATTNQRGAYFIKGLRGGVHVVRTGQSHAAFRFWTNKSAPPAAQRTALNIVEGDTIRGQMGNLYAGDPGMMAVGAIAIAGLVVAIDKQESINDLKTALSQQTSTDTNFVTSDALTVELPVSP